MIIYDVSFDSPIKNLICDDMLLGQAESGIGGEALRLWESPVPFVVLGRIGKEEDDVKTDRCRQDGVGIFRRTSGGGTVVQGPGCLNFSFILSKEAHPALQDLHRSYQEILFPVIEMLASQGIAAIFQPISDLALAHNHKKFSGNAQRRMRHYILHHGTILYDFDLSLIERYLYIPKAVPEYRVGRSHADFVGNVGLPRNTLRESFLEFFPHSSVRTVLSQREQGVLETCLNKKNPLSN